MRGVVVGVGIMISLAGLPAAHAAATADVTSAGQATVTINAVAAPTEGIAVDDLGLPVHGAGTLPYSVTTTHGDGTIIVTVVSR